jgi:hypothetical protein
MDRRRPKKAASAEWVNPHDPEAEVTRRERGAGTTPGSGRGVLPDLPVADRDRNAVPLARCALMALSVSRPHRSFDHRLAVMPPVNSGLFSPDFQIVVRELHERLGFEELIENHLIDSRRGKNTQLPLAHLFRQSVYSRLAGYEDVNDAERVSQDPTFRLIGSDKIWDRGPALTPRLQSFETEMLAEE